MNFVVDFEVWLSVLVDAALISNEAGWDTNLVYNFARLLEPTSDMSETHSRRLCGQGEQARSGFRPAL